MTVAAIALRVIYIINNYDDKDNNYDKNHIKK